MTRMTRWLLPLGLICLLLPGPGWAQGKRPPPPPSAPPAIIRLAWLAGSWRMEKSGRVIDEQWMAPAGGAMLGMTRTLAKGRVIGHEFLQIRVGPGGDLFFVSQPSGQTEAAFQIKSLSDTEVVFENPAQDFPQTISYTLRPDGSLLAAREGPGPDGQVKRIEYLYGKIP
jgi:hypothetical protein